TVARRRESHIRVHDGHRTTRSEPAACALEVSCPAHRCSTATRPLPTRLHRPLLQPPPVLRLRVLHPQLVRRTPPRMNPRRHQRALVLDEAAAVEREHAAPDYARAVRRI